MSQFGLILWGTAFVALGVVLLFLRRPDVPDDGRFTPFLEQWPMSIFSGRGADRRVMPLVCILLGLVLQTAALMNTAS